MLSPLPRRSGWAYSSAHSPPAVSAFPERVVGSACALSFSRLARRSLALRPAHSRCHQCVTRFSEGSSYIVTSIAAPVASGWSDCRVGLSPTGKRRLSTAHTHLCHSTINFAALHGSVLAQRCGNVRLSARRRGAHETARVHHAPRRRSGHAARLSMRRARAASCTRRRVPQWRIARNIRKFRGRIPPRSCRKRFRPGPNRD